MTLLGPINGANNKNFLPARHILSVRTWQALVVSVEIFVGSFMEDYLLPHLETIDYRRQMGVYAIGL